jgi:hypothetical protein
MNMMLNKEINLILEEKPKQMSSYPEFLCKDEG